MSSAPSPWDVTPIPSRVVAIGDLHGDVRAFGAVLRACNLIDARGAWSGGDTHVVLLGDLVGGHEASRLLLNAILRLEREAERAGGRIHALLGNHDVLPVAGRFGKMTRDERALYTRFPVPGARSRDLVDVFRGESTYASWLRRRNAMLRIGDTLFVHAGVERWALSHEPGAVNDTVRAWLAYWQGLGELPPKSTRWAVRAQGGRGPGPLWTRAFKAQARAARKPSRKTLKAIFAAYGVKRMVLGHAPTKDGAIMLEHPRYGRDVVLVDTRISNARRGRMSALTLEGSVLTPVYTADRDAGLPLETYERAALEGSTSLAAARASGVLAGLRGLVRRALRWLSAKVRSLFD